MLSCFLLQNNILFSLMLSSTVKKLPKKTFEIIVKIAKDEIKQEYDKAFDQVHKEFSYQGFRKGKVPRTIAEKQISKEVIYNEMVKNLVPRIYEETVKKENLKPIISPKVELLKAKDNEDWEVKFTLAEKPEIELGNYKEEVKKIKKDSSKKEEIWVPGKDKEKEQAHDHKKEENQQMILNNILTVLLKVIKCEISDLLIEEELNHKLSRLVEDLQKVGLSVDNYLKSAKLTKEQLKDKYSKEITDSYKLEFILAEIADKEGIKVEPADLDKIFANLKNDQEREQAKANSYFYASILRKQKTIDFLTSL